jgi:hypothetical protein
MSTDANEVVVRRFYEELWVVGDTQELWWALGRL